MQPTFLEATENMGLRNDDRAWITEQIRVAIDSLKPHGWRKTIYLLRQLGPLAAIIAIFVAMAAITINSIYQSSAHVKEETEFRTKTVDRLDAIEASIRLLRAPIAPIDTLKEISKLSQQQFAKSLQALRKIEEQPASTVKATPQTLREVAQRLREIDSETPDYWPTVLGFLHFASAGNTGAPPSAPAMHVTSSTLVRVRFAGIRLVLDGGYIEDSTFSDATIVFTDNPVSLRNVRFINCVFEFPVSTTPNIYLQKASQTLLAMPLDSVHFENLS